jgi:hypothetical protein
MKKHDEPCGCCGPRRGDTPEQPKPLLDRKETPPGPEGKSGGEQVRKEAGGRRAEPLRSCRP